jgi:hypothetical protein
MRTIKFQTTKKECQKNIDEFGNVCDRCGRKIKPMITVDNAGQPTYWAGCYHGQTAKGAWGNFTHGVPKEVYELAYKLVLEDGLYLSMDKEKDGNFEYLFQSGVSKVAKIIREIERMKTAKPRFTKKQLEKDYNKFYKS